jgi:hypothetical protein
MNLEPGRKARTLAAKILSITSSFSTARSIFMLYASAYFFNFAEDIVFSFLLPAAVTVMHHQVSF